MKAWLPLIPFAGLLFILPFPGTVAVRLLCLAVAFAIAVCSWRKLAPPPLPAKPALLAWIAVALVSLAYAVDPAYSLGEIKNEIGYAMMAFVAFFAMTDEFSRLRLWGRVVVAVTAVVSLWALAVYCRLGYWDEGGRHGGVGSFASLAVAALPMLLLSWGGLSPRRRVLLLFAALVILLAAVLSQQRILWVAFGIQVVAVIALLRKAGFLNLSRITLAVIITASIAAAGTAMFAVHAMKMDQSTPELQSMDNDTRLAHWRRVFARIQDHPVIGAGFGRESMKKAYPDMVPAGAVESWLWHPHNVFLNYGIAMGWPGMLALLAVFLSLLRVYWTHLGAPGADRRMAAIAGIVLVLGVVTRNLTNDFFLRDGALMFWALNGGLLGFLSRPEVDMPAATDVAGAG